MRVRISSIKINPGRREAEPKAVEELARSIAAVGLLNPITLDQHNTLVAGLHRLEAFPMDVWMKRAMAVFFPDYQQGSFGEYGGIAQQYIYHYSRLHREEL